jgi:hypothetical protein
MKWKGNSGHDRDGEIIGQETFGPKVVCSADTNQLGHKLPHAIFSPPRAQSMPRAPNLKSLNCKEMGNLSSTRYCREKKGKHLRWTTKW